VGSYLWEEYKVKVETLIKKFRNVRSEVWHFQMIGDWCKPEKLSTWVAWIRKYKYCFSSFLGCRSVEGEANCNWSAMYIDKGY